jgi:hypothetical protein
VTLRVRTFLLKPFTTARSGSSVDGLDKEDTYSQTTARSAQQSCRHALL